MQTVADALTTLQKLTNARISQEEFGKALGTGRANISLRIKNGSKLTRDEIQKLEKYFDVKYQELCLLSLDEVDKAHSDIVILDYFPDVCGSCGNGVFQFSMKKEPITVPQNAFFKKFSPVKKYFVINAYGNSMEPVFYDKDKLIVQQWEGEQIIDNKPYLFCYKDEIFIKKLAKNVDQLMIIPENKDYDVRKLEGKQLEDVNIIGLVVGLMRDLR